MAFYRSRFRNRSRRYSRRRYGRRYRNRTRSGGGWMSTAGKALRLATRVAGLVNTEYKVFDQSNSILGLGITNNAAPATQGYAGFTPLTAIGLGDEMNQRNGRSVLMKSLQIRLNPRLVGNLDHVNIRICLMRYLGITTSTIPPVTSVWNQPSMADQWVRAFRSVMYHNSSDYEILWDKQFTIDKDYKSEIQIEKYFKMNKHIKFRDLYDKGHIFLVVFFDNYATDGTFDIPMISRIRYIDN